LARDVTRKTVRAMIWASNCGFHPMLKAKPPTMTADEFLVWNLSQDEKYELVDGVPVPLHAQSGATKAHDRIVVNLIRHLGNRLAGGPCTPTTSDQAVRTAIRKIRRPDVTIECGVAPPDSLEVTAPVAVFEVLSPSNRPSEIVRKIEEYKRHPAIRHIVMIEPSVVSVTRLSRDANGEWMDTTLVRLADTLSLNPPGVTLPLTEIYEDLSPVEEAEVPA
jgi:Uma2 family endonuclease